MKRWIDYKGNIGSLEVSGTICEDYFKRELRRFNKIVNDKLMEGKAISIHINFTHPRVLPLADRMAEIAL